MQEKRFRTVKTAGRGISLEGTYPGTLTSSVAVRFQEYDIHGLTRGEFVAALPRRAKGAPYPPSLKLRRTSRSGANPPIEALARRSLGEGGSDGVGESAGRSPSDLAQTEGVCT